LLEVDPVRPGAESPRAGGGRVLAGAVCQRPGLMSPAHSSGVAISQVFGTALAGKCRGQNRNWRSRTIPLVARLPVGAVPRRRKSFCASCFEPLGLCGRGPAACRWMSSFRSGGKAPYFALETEQHRPRPRICFSHLYVLVPVLDDDKALLDWVRTRWRSCCGMAKDGFAHTPGQGADCAAVSSPPLESHPRRPRPPGLRKDAGPGGCGPGRRAACPPEEEAAEQARSA